MTGRASLLRRVQALEDTARGADINAVSLEDVRDMLAHLPDTHLEQLARAFEAGRLGASLCGPEAVTAAGLNPCACPHKADSAARWAWAYLMHRPPLPPLPYEAAAYFSAQVEAAQSRAAQSNSSEEKARQEDGAAVWASLEVLTRVLMAKQRGK